MKTTGARGICPVRRSPSIKILSILQINFQLYFPLYCIFPQHTRHQPHIPRERIHPPPHFSHSVRDVSRRSDCPAAEALFRKRIAKLPSYCRIMHTIHKNELPRMGAQGESRHGRRVSTVLSGIEALKSIIRTVSWQHSVANERTPLLQGSHSGGLRPVFP